jgi:hypothetical protein
MAVQLSVAEVTEIAAKPIATIPNSSAKVSRSFFMLILQKRRTNREVDPFCNPAQVETGFFT